MIRFLQDMSRQDVANVMRAMRQQALDSAPTGVGIIDPIALYDLAPGFVERGLIIIRAGGGDLRRFDEESIGIDSALKKDAPMLFEIAVDEGI